MKIDLALRRNYEYNLKLVDKKEKKEEKKLGFKISFFFFKKKEKKTYPTYLC